MKTTNTLRKIQRIILTTIILTIFNIGIAQTMYASAGTLSQSNSGLVAGNDLEKNAVKSTSNPDLTVLDQMDQHPDYWVNYLKETVKSENDENAMNKMENDPEYCQHYLQNTVKTDSI